MHWLHDNWLTYLPWVLYGLSELMPLLPTKAQSVIGALLNIGRSLVLGKGKAPALKDWTIEEPKLALPSEIAKATKDEEPKV